MERIDFFEKLGPSQNTIPPPPLQTSFGPQNIPLDPPLLTQSILRHASVLFKPNFIFLFEPQLSQTEPQLFEIEP